MEVLNQQILAEKEEISNHLVISNQKIQNLIQRAVGSPNSGSDGIPDDLEGISYQEALVLLSVKIKESNDLQHKCKEMEKMIDERDEEIQELMSDNNKILENTEQQRDPHPY